MPNIARSCGLSTTFHKLFMYKALLPKFKCLCYFEVSLSLTFFLANLLLMSVLAAVVMGLGKSICPPVFRSLVASFMWYWCYNFHSYLDTVNARLSLSLKLKKINFSFEQHKTAWYLWDNIKLPRDSIVYKIVLQFSKLHLQLLSIFTFLVMTFCWKLWEKCLYFAKF